MKKLSIRAFLFLIIAAAFCTPAVAQKHSKDHKKVATAPTKNYDDSTAEELPVPDPIGLVSDFSGHIFSKGQADTLTAMIRTFKDSTKDEIAIVAWDTLHLGEGEMDDYLKKLADAWDIGDKNKGNGIIIAFALNLREIKIVNATGGLTDKDAQQIVHKIMLPYFVVKNYYAGTVAGMNAVMKNLTE